MSGFANKTMVAHQTCADRTAPATPDYNMEGAPGAIRLGPATDGTSSSHEKECRCYWKLPVEGIAKAKAAGLVAPPDDRDGNQTKEIEDDIKPDDTRPLAPPKNVLSYSQALGGMLPAGNSPSQFANILRVPRQRPNIVQAPSPGHGLYSSLAEAKQTGWNKKKRRRSSATAGAVVVRPAVRSHHGVIESVVPETREAENAREKKETIHGEVKTKQPFIVDPELSKPVPGDDKDVNNPAMKQGARVLTVEEIKDQLFKGKQRAADSDCSEDGPTLIASLISRLLVPITRPKSANSVLIPSSSYSREDGRFPDNSSQQRASVDEYVPPPAPEVPTYFQPVLQPSQKGTVPFSAPLVPAEFPQQQRVAVPRDSSSSQQPPLLSSWNSSCSSSSQQLENQDPSSFVEETKSLEYYFRYQKRPLGHNYSSSSPPLTLYQRRAMSRRERSPEEQGIGNQTAMPPAKNPLTPRQTGLPAVPGTPTYRDVQMTPAQAETGQRIAAIWRDADANAQGAYSPSVYSRPANNDRNSASTAAPHAQADVPISFRPSPDDNTPRPGNRDAIGSASTLGPVSFDEVNNLMSLLTEHIVAQVTSSRDAVVDALVARIDALSQEVARLKATQQQLLVQQGALLNLAQRRHHAINSASVSGPFAPGPGPFCPPAVPARSGSTFARRPARRQHTGGGGAAATYVPPPPPRPPSQETSSPHVRFREPSGSSSTPRGHGASGSVSRLGPLDPVGFGTGAVPENYWYHRAHPAGR